MKIPKLSFVLGFRKLSEVILANEAFTEPEPYEEVLADLREIGLHLELLDSELRIECPINGKPEIKGAYRFLDGDRFQQELWRQTMLKLAELGAEYLKKSVAMLKFLPIQAAVDDYLSACAWPRPEHVEINELSVWRGNLDGLPLIGHTVEYQGTNVKLRLPQLALPFPKTATKLMQEIAQHLVEEEADRRLQEQTGEDFDSH
ncbi:hypothetical protein KJ611_01090 [Patescibacteria group bacterium]|nr:hypothetical protein [Patescibacteria group bacterium]MBU1705280.1 hypothetical protein [Patescibacteria group bacterium]